MNDFLQSLRGGHKDKRTAKTRRGFDNSNFNTAPNFQSHGNYQGTRAGNIKRPVTRGSAHVHMPGGEHQPSYPPQLEPLDVMLELMDVYTKNQEMLINVNEKRVIAEERKAIALEEIAEYLRVITMPSFKESFSFQRTASTSASPISKDIDGDEASDPITSEALEANIADNESSYGDVVDAENVDAEYIDSEEFNKKSDDFLDADYEDVDSMDVDSEYGNKKDIDKSIDDTQDVEFSMKPSIKASPREDEKKTVKVIRRKKADIKESSPFQRSKMIDISSDMDSETEDISGKEASETPEGTNRWLSGKKEAIIPPPAVSTATESEGGALLLTREEVMEIIHSMRAKGKTFDEVAQHLVALGQPTFSGRGDWHAQTIHRLCTKRSNKSKKGK
ncbi:MAG: hypothetical protein HQK62_08475 [Desulfamplus sp.]|nr:hypothetical protein [Desulfamplus sp.]